MPIFEYKCGKCKHLEEFLEKAGSSRKHKCPKCSQAMAKQFSTFSGRMGKPQTPAGCANTGCPNAGSCPKMG